MKHVVIVDDNRTIQVWLYEGREGVAAEVTPQRALVLARQLLDAASRHLAGNLRGGPDLDTDTDQINPTTGLKLFP